MELSGGDWAQILLRDAESGTMVGQYWTGRHYAWRARADKALRVEPGQGGAGLVLATGRPFRTDNYIEDPRLSSEYREVVREEHVVALVAVPIGAGGEIDGVLCVGNQSPRPFTERDEAVLGRLGRSVAPAVRNAQAHSQSERRRRAAESLVAMGQALSHSLNVERAAREICESARELFDARAAMLARLLPGEQRLEVVATAGDPGPAVRAGVSIAPEMGIPWVAAREKRSVFTPDVLRDPRVTLTPELAACIGESEDRAMVCVPLHAQGSVSGVLCVRDRAGRVFDEHELRLAEAFAAQAAVVLENATLYADMAVRRREAEELARVGVDLSGTLDVETVSRRIVRSVLRLSGGRFAALWLVEPGGALRAVTTAGDAGGQLASGQVTAPGESVAGRAFLQRRPIWVRDALSNPDLDLSSEDRVNIERSGLGSILAVPVGVAESVIGALLAGDRTGRGYSQAEVTLLGTFANHAALAIRNARLFADAERRRRIAEALAATQRLITRSLDPAEVGQAICDSVTTLFGARSSLLLRVERVSQGLVLLAGAGDLGPGLEPGLVIPAGIGFPDVALRERRAVQTQDVLSDPRVRLTEEVRTRLAQAPDRAVLCVPLMAQDQVIGLLSIRDRAGRLFDAEEVSVAEAFAGQAATALENARLFAESERGRRTAESLAAVGRMISRSLDPVEVGRGICEIVQRLLGGQAAALYRVEPGSGDLVGIVSSGEEGWGFERPFVLPRGTGIVGLAAAERQPLATPNVLRDPRVTITPELRARLEAVSFRAALAVPLLVNEQVVGVLSIVDAEGRRFGADEIGMAQAFAGQAAVVWENARLYHQASSHRQQLAALTDELGRAQEDERRRLSHEIHDEMGQTLSAIQISLDIAREDLHERPEDARARIEAAMAAVKDALGEVRRIANDLRPVVLDELGLGAAIQRHVARVGALTGLSVDLSTEGRPRRLRSDLETHIYRALQETLSNVVKHSGAQRASCRLEYLESTVALTVEDDGGGFEPLTVMESAWKEGRLGLIGLRERVRSLDGRLSIVSEPGRGTRIRIELPGHESEAGAESAPRLPGA